MELQNNEKCMELQSKVASLMRFVALQKIHGTMELQDNLPLPYSIECLQNGCTFTDKTFPTHQMTSKLPMWDGFEHKRMDT